MNRREFLVKTSLTAAGCAAAKVFPKVIASETTVMQYAAIVFDRSDPVAASAQAQWAAGQLQAALVARGFFVGRYAKFEEVTRADICILAAGPASAAAREAGVPAPADAEGLAIGPGKLGGRAVLVASGGGVRGLVYALTELADEVADDPNPALHPARVRSEKPANSVRSVMRSFTSDVEDKAWFHDRDFWRRYLSMLASQRFNRFNLAFGLGYDAPNRLRDTYLYFAYPFLLSVPGYDVRATNLSDAERDLNLEMLRFVSDEAALRGLEFQLGLWTHAYEWTDSPEANHVITGLTPKTQGPYSRDALALVLKECPGISGVTFRIHGESGVPEGSYDLWKMIFDGCARDGKRLRIDMHAKGMTDEMIAVARDSGSEFTISPKFWAEHMGLPYHQAAIRPTEMPVRTRGTGAFAASEGARSFLRYGYGDLLTESRRYGILHRIWPGTQRVLLWGDPSFAAGYGRAMSFCGSLGAEIFEPLSFKGREGSGQPGGDRCGYADASLRPAGGDFEKFLITYRFWGRTLYSPQADGQGWARQFRREFGPAAESAGVVLRHASRILPLVTTAHLPSASNNTFWPEMYANMPIAAGAGSGPYSDTPSPKRFGTVSPLDPQIFSRIEDYVDARLQGPVDGKFSPVEVAQLLEDLSHSVFEHLAEADKAAADKNAPAYRRLSIDVQVQGHLGRFFGQKLRAGVFYAIFERTGDPVAKAEALRLYRSAREAWAGIVAVTNGVYVADVSYGDGLFKRGNWSDRLAAIDKDIAAVEASAAPAPKAAFDGSRVAAMIREAAAKPQRPAINATHAQPGRFQRGQPVALTLAFPADHGQDSVRLHYRRVNQSESWRAAPMELADGSWRAEIPGAYTDSDFALQYYFEPVDHAAGLAWIHPGLGSALARPPYYVLRQA
jgi:hypothetical protein